MEASVAVAGGTLSMEIAGVGQPSLLMLHGWTLDRRMWRSQVRGLSDMATLLLPDRRGFGRSPAPPGLAQEPDDVPALLDHLGLASAIIVGHSQAGRVALTAAARYPDRVVGLVLLAAPHDGAPPDPAIEPPLPLARLTDMVRSGDVAAARQLWRSHPMLRVPDAATAQLLDEILGDYEGRDLLVPAQALPIDDDLLTSIRCPALILTGDADAPSRVTAAQRLADGLRHATLLLLPGAGHMATISHADAVNRAIRDFLTR